MRRAPPTGAAIREAAPPVFAATPAEAELFGTVELAVVEAMVMLGLTDTGLPERVTLIGAGREAAVISLIQRGTEVC